MHRPRAWCSGAVAAVLPVAGCTTSVGGSGSAVSGSPSSFPSVSPSVSVSPSATAPSTPIGSVKSRRTVRATAIGDPVTADLCASLDLSAFADSTEAFDGQPLGACDLHASASDGTYVVFVNTAVPDSGNDDGGVISTESGLQVVKYPILNGHCDRYLEARGVTLRIGTNPTSTPAPDANELCAAADILTKELAADVAGHKVPRVSLAQLTITALSPCRSVSPARIAKIMGVGKVEIDPIYFDSGCEWITDAGNELRVYMNIYQADEELDDTPVIVGTHRLLREPGAGSQGSCDLTSEQGLAQSGGGVEVLDFEINAASTKTPAATTCGQAKLAGGAILDGLQLK